MERLSERALDLTQRHFRMKYSITDARDIDHFSGQLAVYPTSNEPYFEELFEVIHDKAKGGLVVGIVGGFDMSMSMAVASGATELVLFDSNPYACDFGEWRSRLIPISKSPTDYLGYIYPGDLGLGEIYDEHQALYSDGVKAGWDQDMASQFAALNCAYRRLVRANREPTLKYIQDGLDRLLITNEEKQKIIGIAIKNRRLRYDPRTSTVVWHGEVEMENLIAAALTNVNHWLHPSNFEKAKELKVRIFHSPIQLLGANPLISDLAAESKTIKLFYASNVLQYLSSHDYDSFLDLIKTLPGGRDMMIAWFSDIQYGVTGSVDRVDEIRSMANPNDSIRFSHWAYERRDYKSL